MKKRTRARELALQFLYQVDLLGTETASPLDDFLRQEERDVETCRFTRRLVDGTLEHKAGIDEEISSVAQNWHISRMAVIDRNVLRLATFELLHCDDIPPKVAINEAIELGKRFSTENSGAFINGILDRIKNKAKAASAAAADGDGVDDAAEVEAEATDEGDSVQAESKSAPAGEPSKAPDADSPWNTSRFATGGPASDGDRKD
ncbi:MAG: N utilization substance protein B [Planctomycetota bacterium]